MKYLIVILICISQALAIDITPIEKGQPAPANGFFVDQENMKEFREINERKKLLEKENLTLKDIRVIQDEQIDNYKEIEKELYRQVRKEKFKSDIKGIGGFILGVAAASLAAYAAIKVTK